MQGVCKNLLAHAALAGQQHVRLARRDARDELFDLAHPPADRHRPELRLGLAELLLQRLFFPAQLRRLAGQGLMIQYAGAEAHELLHDIRFREKMKRPQLDRLDGVRERVVRAQDDHRQLRVCRLQLPQHIQPIGIRQPEIEQ